MTIDEFDEYAKAHDCVIFTRQQYEHVIDVFNDYELLLFDYYGRLKVDMVEMLTDLSKKVDASPINPKASEAFKLGQATAFDRCESLIRRKINELKAESEEEHG